MLDGNRVKILALFLVIFLLSACVTQGSEVDQEGINEPSNILQSDRASLPITPTPFLPEPLTSPIVNDDVAIRTVLIERMGSLVNELGISLSENTGLHAKGEVGEEYFLAYKDENGWIIAYVGLANPPCQVIIDAQFPIEMVPECMDEENNVVILVPATEAAIRIALGERIGIGTEEMEIRITDSSGDYLSGRVNNGYFFAVNRNDTWLIVHDGPAAPPCKDIEAYQFPIDIVPQCLDKNNKLVTR